MKVAAKGKNKGKGHCQVSCCKAAHEEEETRPRSQEPRSRCSPALLVRVGRVMTLSAAATLAEFALSKGVAIGESVNV